jgi:hypothetical protein
MRVSANYRRYPAILLLLTLTGFAGAEDAPAIDPMTGLKMAENWELVRNNCSACHSTKLITQQRGTAAQWLGMIRWMQEKQNLWPFDPETETRIITYLAEQYAPSEERRRAAIPPDLMPPNPYSETAQGENQGSRD